MSQDPKNGWSVPFKGTKANVYNNLGYYSKFTFSSDSISYYVIFKVIYDLNLPLSPQVKFLLIKTGDLFVFNSMA